MKTFKLQIDAHLKNSENIYYSYEREKNAIKKADIYEAITKYLQVKGYDASCVKVEESDDEK